MNKSIGKVITVTGLISIILGIIFTAQSKSVIGPSSSFMYANPSWTVNGSALIGIGIAVLLLGIIIWRFSSK
ncbi:hypothetical protein DYY65_09765 [Nitrososphaera sp. AFS]|nr:hypothetical protein [Nitrososphaera sp. AFS]